MHLDLTILAKSDKHIGFCVAGLSCKGKIIRLVRDKEATHLVKNNVSLKSYML